MMDKEGVCQLVTKTTYLLLDILGALFVVVLWEILQVLKQMSLFVIMRLQSFGTPGGWRHLAL